MPDRQEQRPASPVRHEPTGPVRPKPTNPVRREPALAGFQSVPLAAGFSLGGKAHLTQDRAL